MLAWYNEIDPGKAAWLRNLIEEEVIAPGVVDERDLRDIAPAEIQSYSQCHFFAGIGAWSFALRQAGFKDTEQVWTASCPCQPFSTAGQRKGFDDDRHLWPDFFWFVQQLKPKLLFGEQVASKDGLAWLDIVQADLERTNHAYGAVDSCAAGFGAPHIRQRLYFGAERLANTHGTRATSRISEPEERQKRFAEVDDHSGGGLLRPGERRPGLGSNQAPYATNGFWRDADWLGCRDGKWRAVEPGTSPLVNGSSSRVLQLRAYGDCIVAPQAAAFAEAFQETTKEI